MYPKPDRSDQSPNSVKSEENEAIDLGCNENFLSDGRPYIAECWAESHITMLTFFFSTIGMENYSNEKFIELLGKEGLVRFVTNELHVSAMKIIDASGNDIWSVNVVIGTEDGLEAKFSKPSRT